MRGYSRVKQNIFVNVFMFCYGTFTMVVVLTIRIVGGCVVWKLLLFQLCCSTTIFQPLPQSRGRIGVGNDMCPLVP